MKNSELLANLDAQIALVRAMTAELRHRRAGVR